MAPEVAAVLAEQIGSGRLAVRSGAVELAATTNDGLVARLSGSAPIEVALAVNCTGPGLDPRQSHNPLVVQLLRDGHARPHPLNIGFDTAPDGAFISRDGIPSQRLLTLGPPRIGELYETVAIPEIRNQAQALAATLAATLERDSPPVPLAARLA
jgi:uncharacterized NAD(P)/FAD-binding protein YdhS